MFQVSIPRQELKKINFPCSCFADTVYFHLPPLGGERKCVYGVSCYRQIEAKVGDAIRAPGVNPFLCSVTSLEAMSHASAPSSGPEGPTGRRHQGDGPEERVCAEPGGEQKLVLSV